MAFSSSSYFVGVGTAFAAIAVGFAGGAMITTNAVQPPNKLEQRAASNATPPSSVTPATTASSSAVPQQANVTTPATQPPAQVQATAPVAPAADSPPVQQPQPAAPVAAKIDSRTDVATKTDAATNTQQPPTSPPQAARNEDATPAKNERASARSADVNREASRKRGDERKFDERKFTERKRRQDLDEATSVVRQMPRDSAVEVVDEDDAPRIANGPPRRFGLFGDGEDSPRAAPPPRFGLFGN
jgi:type IV secretory pathway VirB10-like protein